jgi:hypothetical protein
MGDLPYWDGGLTPEEKVNIAVEGKSVEFGLTGNAAEYVVSSLDAEELCIPSCMKTLHDYTDSHEPGWGLFLIDIAVRLDSHKGSWEPSVLGIYIWEDTSCLGVRFTINAAIKLQEAVVREVVNSCLRGNSTVTLRGIEPDEQEVPIMKTDRLHGWDISLSLDSDTRLLFRDLLRLRLRISQELFFPREALTIPYMLLQAIRTGNADSLIGQTESEWLEVKSHAYELQRKDEAWWKTEFAQDVSQFANSTDGGLLLIGFWTRKVNGIDKITKITPVVHDPKRLQRYGDILKDRIHPPISGLQVGSVRWNNADIIYIYIPAQQDENKPYIVTGTIIDKCDISIVRRQGAECAPVTAQEIHAALVIGRAAIRKQQ